MKEIGPTDTVHIDTLFLEPPLWFEDSIDDVDLEIDELDHEGIPGLGII